MSLVNCGSKFYNYVQTSGVSLLQSRHTQYDVVYNFDNIVRLVLSFQNISFVIYEYEMLTEPALSRI